MAKHDREQNNSERKNRSNSSRVSIKVAMRLLKRMGFVTMCHNRP